MRILLYAARVLKHNVLFRIESRAVVILSGSVLVFFADERFVNDDFRLAEFHIACFRIECRADDLPAFAVFAAICGCECRAESLNHRLARNAALLLEFFKGGVKGFEVE